MLNQNPHREIKLPELFPRANTESDFTSISENLVNQATKEKENIPALSQKISLQHYIEQNSKLLAAFWLCLSLAGLLFNNMEPILNSVARLEIFLPAFLLMWEVLETFPKAKKCSPRLSIFYASILGTDLFLSLYLVLPFLSSTLKSPLIQNMLYYYVIFIVILFLGYYLMKFFKPDILKNIRLQLEK
jgi:cation transporter-like permease